MLNHIKIVAFDADDTLWANESYFHTIEKAYCELLSAYLPTDKLSAELFDTEMRNIGIYGYGVKSFTLSMIETALRVTDGKVAAQAIEQILSYGKSLLQMPVELLPGVRAVLEHLNGKYKLVVATKGDLLNQEQKLLRSGLQSYFHHVEIMSDKQVVDYQKLIRNLACLPQELLMVGNSMKSDVLPVLQIGGYAAHIPYHITWQHEQIDEPVIHPHFFELNSLEELIDRL